ncbi:peptidoglycan DD-metalloendopeptidase family protein [Burkholderia guangdongensis]|uniref:peptidoglycan DD-metalloendopeptidase family protein n=1 Tax=Burkholderia guangdongensis TaxID=1792500 RepID=UPI0015CC1230|nr:peptidoglycan DD-metalloendopeptidase family protein [Burkholderia guangdongensis]
MSGTTIKRLVAASSAALLVACGTASVDSSGPVGPGYYRVARGDTLYKIARANRQSVQNIVRWNNIANPDSIDVGQMLRVTPPGGAATASSPSTGSTGSTTSRPAQSAAADSSAPPANGISLIWPARGNVVRNFDGGKSKGIDIASAVGTPVVAAAPGVVVYAGNGLRGYGNLLILKHDGDYLTAYAHNRRLLVSEGQSVTQGQTIAEMGDTDNDRVALHFELRYAGRSIDPSRYLPAR